MPFSISRLIIPRDRYWPEGFSPRVDIGGGMITVLIWKKACINLFIMHIFQHWIKKNKIYFPHIFFIFSTKESVYASKTPTNLSLLDTDIFQTTIDSWAEVTTWGSREAWYRVIRVLPQYLPMGWYRCGTSGVYVWAKLALLLINMWYIYIMTPIKTD
jgi:hypothetical protein